MNKNTLSVFLLSLSLSLVFLPKLYAQSGEEIRYVAVGDSYSIGTGVEPHQAWPTLLAEHLKSKGVNISLVANPSRNGWTTLHVQEWEMPVVRNENANFVTVMIGVNDWVQWTTEERFRESFADVLDDLIPVVTNKRILVVNIPDFSCAPEGPKFSQGRNIPKGIARFNKIIDEESHKREIPVVDVFIVSQKMCFDSSLVAKDGLHPSVQGHLLFEETIFPVAEKILK